MGRGSIIYSVILFDPDVLSVWPLLLVAALTDANIDVEILYCFIFPGSVFVWDVAIGDANTYPRGPSPCL